MDPRELSTSNRPSGSYQIIKSIVASRQPGTPFLHIHCAIGPALPSRQIDFGPGNPLGRLAALSTGCLGESSSRINEATTPGITEQDPALAPVSSEMRVPIEFEPKYYSIGSLEENKADNQMTYRGLESCRERDLMSSGYITVSSG